jgi:hypothetical protein
LSLVTTGEIVLVLNVKLLSTVNLDNATPVDETVIAVELFVVNNKVLFVGCAITFVNLFAEYTPPNVILVVSNPLYNC